MALHIITDILIYTDCVFQAFYGVVFDVVGIAAGKTKVPSASAPISEDSTELNEAEHLKVSVYDLSFNSFIFFTLFMYSSGAVSVNIGVPTSLININLHISSQISVCLFFFSSTVWLACSLSSFF